MSIRPDTIAPDTPSLLEDLQALKEMQIELADSVREIQFQEFRSACEFLEKQAEETAKLITEIKQLRQIENLEAKEGANGDDNDKQ